LLSTLEWIKENNTVNIPALIDDVIENGVKYTGGIGNPNWMGNKVEKAIENGVREIQPLPAQDGNRDWGNYYYRKGEPTKPHTKYVDEVIENGIKENPSF
jgi:hypothetical protein